MEIATSDINIAQIKNGTAKITTQYFVVPSEERFLTRIRNLDVDEVETMFDDAIRKTVTLASVHNGFKHKIVVALDFHRKPFYGLHGEN